MRTKKIKIPPINILHQNRKDSWVHVGLNESFITSGLTYHYEVLPNLSTIPTWYIKIYFTNGKFYNIAFFNCESSMDLAKRTIESAKKGDVIYLSQEVFFAFPRFSPEKLIKKTAKFNLKDLLNKAITGVQSGMYTVGKVHDFVACCNNNPHIKTKFTVEIVNLLLQNKYPVGLSKEDLVLDLSCLLRIPKEFKEKVPPTMFFEAMVNKLK